MHAAAPRRVLAGLAPPLDIDGPRVRLGVAWALVTVIATTAGAGWAAAWMAPTAAIAAVQVARSWRDEPVRAVTPVAAGGAALVALAGGVGLVAVGSAALVVVVVAVAWEPARTALGRSAAGSRTAGSSTAGSRTAAASAAPGPAVAGRTVLAALPVGLAVAAVAASRHQGGPVALALLGLVFAHDASAYLIGSGGKAAWEGTAAAVAAMGVVTLGMAAVLVPPFRGTTPWVFGLLAIIATPFGPRMATLLLGDRTARVPALRRLDALLLTGPLWVLASVALLR